MSAWEERAEIIAALSAGVHGYIPKSLHVERDRRRDPLDARRPDLRAARAWASASRRNAARAAAVDAERRREAHHAAEGSADELLKGQASKEIARALDIAEGTVKIHLAAIYRALGVRTRAEAIAKLKSN